MNVETLELHIYPQVGFTENCYVISSSADYPHVAIIDPGAEAARIIAAVGERSIDAIILTHRHDDHIGAVSDLAAASHAPVYAFDLEADAIESFTGSAFGRQASTGVNIHVDHRVCKGDIIEVAGVALEVIHTPGHTLGSICLYSAEAGVLISGETWFRGTTGRTDLPTGNPLQMHESLNVLAGLPDETVVYPGHDGTTIIAFERDKSLIEY
jgi:glyoxylase-like metal-dependent hydrolase (beta-lactamase superfamily II)